MVFHCYSEPNVLKCKHSEECGYHRQISDEEIWRALETAELKDEIKNMPLGLDMIAGEGDRISQADSVSVLQLHVP